MTLAGWDEKACLAAASDPQTTREVLDYFISPDNVRPKLLLALLENPSVPEAQIVKLASSAMRDTVEIILKSKRSLSMPRVVNTLSSNPYLRKEEAAQLRNRPSDPVAPPSVPAPAPAAEVSPSATPNPAASVAEGVSASTSPSADEKSAAAADEHDEAVTVYMKDHAADIAAESDKPFQPIGGVVELLGQDYFPVVDSAEISAPPEPASPASGTAAKPAAANPPVKLPVESKRENTLQKINRLDVKGRIQLALKGSKEERSILIRDGTKVVAFAVLEAPKLSDGEVEKFASQKNVLETVLRQITLKRRFMKNYIVIRNLCANPRTPLDLGLGLMKNLLIQDLKNISANKEVSETIRKLALKMYKQKLDEANKK
jgi:hypothetical protein